MPDEPCAMDEGVLLDYIWGTASPELRAAIEISPACRAAAEQLARELRPLMQLMYRVVCPDAATLVAYQEGRLDSTAQLVWRQHLAECPHCQAEYQMMTTMDTIPLMPRPGVLRRVIEAVFQPPHAAPVALRGEVLHYQTPQISIVLSTRRGSAKPIHWNLRGEARTHDGQRMIGQLENVVLRPLEAADAGETQGSVAENGTFAFQGLPAGRYSLHIFTPEEEVIIRHMVIGDLP